MDEALVKQRTRKIMTRSAPRVPRTSATSRTADGVEVAEAIVAVKVTVAEAGADMAITKVVVGEVKETTTTTKEIVEVAINPRATVVAEATNLMVGIAAEAVEAAATIGRPETLWLTYATRRSTRQRLNSNSSEAHGCL